MSFSDSFDFSAPLRFCVIGDPVGHSLSPVMHQAAFAAMNLDAEYQKIPVKREALPLFSEFARRGLDGFNITVPHKNAIIPQLDSLSTQARLTGSVNTVIVQSGRLIGDSTDGYGLATALSEAFHWECHDGVAVILGAGGASVAGAFYLALHGVRQLTIVNRTLERAVALQIRLQQAAPACTVLALTTAQEHLQEVAARLAEADVVINATSSGLKADDPPPIPLELLGKVQNFFDTIYLQTPMQRFVRQCNIPCADGRLMLLHQGAKALELWLHQTPPVDVMRQALERALTHGETQK